MKGGMHNVSLALASYLRSKGGEIRTNAGVEKILVSSGRATGVRLENGEEISAKEIVASGVDPGQLTLRFLGEEVVGSEIAGKMERYEWGDPAFVIYAALDGPVGYKAGQDAGSACHVHLTPPSLDPMSKASAECRGGELPATPLIVSWNDSVIDPSRAPEGKHLKKFVVLGVPYEIRGDSTGRISGRTWDEARDEYADYLIEMISADYIPDLKAKLLKREAHSPLDIERKLQAPCTGRSATAPCCLTRRARCDPYRRWVTIVPLWRTSTCAAQGATPVLASRWPQGGTRQRRSAPTSASTSPRSPRRSRRRATGRLFPWLAGAYRLVEVGDKILLLLDADGEAHEAVRDAPGLALLSRDGGVGHGGRVGDKGLDPTQTFGEVEDARLLNRRVCGLGAALERE